MMKDSFRKTLLATFMIAGLGALVMMVEIMPLRAGAAWGPGSCPPVGASYQWKHYSSDPDRHYLFQYGQQIGAYDQALDYYRPYDARSSSWGECCRPPIDPPWNPHFNAALGGIGEEKHFFGVDHSRRDGQERFVLHNAEGSREISRQQAFAAVEKGLIDDSKKLRVTVIGNESERRKVGADLEKISDLAEWAVVREYAPDHWIVKPGFVTSGHPTLYCQAPDGRVLHRQDDYQGGAEGVIGALRKARANYDAKKDPDLRKPSPAPPDPVPVPGPIMPWRSYLSYLAALLLGGGASWLLLRPERKVTP